MSDAGPGPGAYTGPSTEQQWGALRHLEAIARAADGHAPAIGPLRRSRWESSWPLYVVLAVQAALTLSLTWLDSVFVDESLYLWAGRNELWHLSSGAPVPIYAAWFSGSPAIYPPLAGAADMADGLPAARLLSLLFMLGVTCLLWGSTRSLFGRRAALGATALFVALGPTQFLGALATYDAMALFLLTLSARLVIAARDRRAWRMMLAGAILALAAANATKYATGIFDPVVIALAVFASPRGPRAGLMRGAVIAAGTVAVLAILLVIGGHWYVTGITQTTLTRQPGSDSPLLVLADSVKWIGIPLAISVVGVAISRWRDRSQSWLLTVLALAGLLVPVNQARIHTTVSLSKHTGFGAWFACIAAGYAIALLTRDDRRDSQDDRPATRRPGPGMSLITGPVLMSGVVLVLTGVIGTSQARGFHSLWPNTTTVTTALRPLAEANPGPYLIDQADLDIFGYALENQVPWQNWKLTAQFSYRAPGQVKCVGGTTPTVITPASPAVEAYAAAIEHGYFALVVFTSSDPSAIDQAVVADIQRYGTYHVVAERSYDNGRTGGGHYVVWARTVAGLRGSHGSYC